MSESLKIVRLRAENFKRLRAVEIRPQGNVVQITGANSHGKTSVLDAIMAAIGGRGKAPARPIRDGAEQAIIQVDLGRYEVTRLFTKDERQPPICVRPKEGAGMAGKPIRSAQDLLDQMLGDLTFDPLAFTRMKAREQYEELRRIAKLGPELDEFDRLNEVDYAERANWNRIAKDAQAQANGIDIPEDLPAERMNAAQLAEDMDKAAKHNADIEKRKLNRQAAADRAKDLNARGQKIIDGLAPSLDKIRDKFAKKIAELERERDREIEITMKDAERDAALLKTELLELQAKLDGAEPLPALIDMFPIKEAIANAQWVNSGIEKREQRQQRLAEAELAQEKSKELTKQMEERTRQKHAMIAQAKMPVAGLGLEDGGVTYNGVPFEQASSAEQLRVSIGIAMAANPTLRILRITDGSLLDSKSMALIGEMAQRESYQIWIERVSDDKEAIGIVIEDGTVVADNQVVEHAEVNLIGD